jgi:hypothetical protein
MVVQVCCKAVSKQIDELSNCLIVKLTNCLSLLAMSIKLKLLPLIAICLASGLTYSQNRNFDGNSSGQSQGQQKYAPGKKGAAAKKDTVVFKMKVYQFQNGYSQVGSARLDTVLTDYETYNPILKKTLTAQTLGNLGIQNPMSFCFFEIIKITGNGKRISIFITQPNPLHYSNTDNGSATGPKVSRG